MYQITIFTFINGRCHFTPFETKNWEIARYRLCWALDLPSRYYLLSGKDVNLLLIKDVTGKPIPYRVIMPGHEKLPPVYLTFDYIQNDGEEK